MKYIILVGDGMADLPLSELEGKTPLSAAVKPAMDYIASKGINGRVSTVPEGMVPESDTANMAILSFDPKVYSRGRSPLEAISMGLEMAPDETAYRCNVVTLSENEDYDHREELIAQFNAEVDRRRQDASLEPWQRISAALGCARFDPAADHSADSVLQHADAAMYRRKKQMKG